MQPLGIGDMDFTVIGVTGDKTLEQPVRYVWRTGIDQRLGPGDLERNIGFGRDM